MAAYNRYGQGNDWNEAEDDPYYPQNAIRQVTLANRVEP
jgi:hypothetical protein